MRSVRILCLCLLLAMLFGSSESRSQAQTKGAVLYEGARLVTGDGSPAVENAGFVVENGRFTQVGRKGEVKAPSGVTRVDLTGKTVIPGIVDAHNHIGYQNMRDVTDTALKDGLPAWDLAGKQFYTRDNIVDHLNRAAYVGVAAVMSMGYDFGDVGFQVRDDTAAGKIANAARYMLAGRGLATHDSLRPDAGRQDACGVDVPDEGIKCVQEAVAHKVKLIKLWVVGPGGGRFGSKVPMNAESYTAVIDEAHKLGARVVVHTEAEFAKGLLRAGVDGFAHINALDTSDAEVMSLLKERGPKFFAITTAGGASPDWQEHPPALLTDMLRPRFIKALRDTRAAQKAKETPESLARLQAGARRDAKNMQNLMAAGTRVVMGSDAGGINVGQNLIGWSAQVELEDLVASGLTPAQAIVTATKNSAEALGLNDMGTVAQGKSADFVVLDANPLDDIKNTRQISKVFLRGTEVDRASLKAKWARP